MMRLKQDKVMSLFFNVVAVKVISISFVHSSVLLFCTILEFATQLLYVLVLSPYNA